MTSFTAELPTLVCRRFDQLGGVRFGFSSRQGGKSPFPLGMNLSFNVGDSHDNVVENRIRFFRSLGIDESRVAFPRQCHSARVVRVQSAGSYDSCDALITNDSQLFLAVTVADCVPIFFYDPIVKAVASVHAGWRGASLKIVPAAVEALRLEFNSKASHLIAFVGPSARVCCYEVGQEVAEKFDARFTVQQKGKLFLDLKGVIHDQLSVHGVMEENIEICDFCTICNPDLFHSFRRDKERSGRMMGVIGLT